jgi:nitrate reductase gamma subunit
MKRKSLLDFIGILLLFIGFVLAFLPHAFHASIGLNDSVSHTKHVITGLILVVLALAVLIYNNQALKKIF